MWVIFSFISAFCETAKDALGKQGSSKINEYILAFALQLFAALFLLPVVMIVGIPEIKPLFWPTSLASLVFIPSWSILYMKALKLSPLSVSVPMLAFNPVFTALLAIFFEGRWPSAIGWLGVFLIAAGLYIFRLEPQALKHHPLAPLTKIKDEPGAMAMLGVALIWSVGTFIAKYNVAASSPLFSSLVGCTLGALVLYIIARSKTEVSVAIMKKHWKFLLALGALNGISELAMRTALATGFTPYVISIKRSNIVWSSLVGKLFFQEELKLNKVLSIACMVVGVIILIVLR